MGDNMDVELSLKLCLGGRFSVKRRRNGENRRRLELQGRWKDRSWQVRSSSVPGGFPTPVNDVYRSPLERTESLPLEIEDERRKRLHAKIKKRMDARRRRELAELAEIDLNLPAIGGGVDDVEISEVKGPFVYTVARNGRKMDGILLKYGQLEEVSIVCTCHGDYLSPEEFIQHAGGREVANPLQHIVVHLNSTYVYRQ